MAEYDLGPFQELAGINFPQNNYEDFQDGEDFEGRTDCGDAGTQYTIQAAGVQKFAPGTRGCICAADPAFSGGQEVQTIRFWFPLTGDIPAWPACAVGGSSGAIIAKDWPAEPGNWGTASPDPISGPTPYYCTSGVRYQGAVQGSSYLLIMDFTIRCIENIYENCC